MSKKKISNKEKSKVTKKKDEFSFRENENNEHEDEYITVADTEANKKYNKRPIQSNWSKYETNVLDFDSSDEGNETPKTDDFNHLLKTASSDCSHFQFNSEKQWKSEESSMPPSNIFNLDLNFLASGLSCVPFYEMMGLDESYLTLEEKQRFDAAAEKNLKEYALIRDKLHKKEENVLKIKNSENIKTLDESLKVKLTLNVNSEEVKKIDELKDKELTKTDENLKKVELFENNESSGEGENKPKILFSENDEDLEGWLDSVLDD